MKQSHHGKLAVVTGASRGIGTFICQDLLDLGINVIGIARNETELNNQGKKFKTSGTFYPTPFDLSKISDIPSLIQSLHDKFGHIDILVNNAGVEHYRNFENHHQSVIEQILSVNLMAPMMLTKSLIPSMKEKGGHILTVTSVAGKVGLPFNSVYSASKGGANLWMEALIQELHGTKVLASTILPGYIHDTGLFHTTGMTPPGLVGSSSPQDVAKAVVKVLNRPKAQQFVTKGPIRPLFVLKEFIPTLTDKVMRKIGIVEMNKRYAKSLTMAEN